MCGAIRPFDERDEDIFLHWTVIAVVVHADSIDLLPAGVAVAAELGMAADQVCNHLPVESPAVGICYLVATPSTAEMDTVSGHLVTVPRLTWVNRLCHDENGWSLSEWVPALGGLRGLDLGRDRTDHPDSSTTPAVSAWVWR